MSDHNVVEIKRKKKAEKKPQRADLYLAVSQAINRTPASTLRYQFPRFGVFCPALGTRLAVAIGKDDVLTVVQLSVVADEILRATKSLGEAFAWDYKGCLEASTYWLHESMPLSGISQIRWLSEPGYTFRRLPFDAKEGPHPCWDEVLDRMTNAKSFMAFIGSLFDPRSDRQQYLYLYGEGMNGKGAIDRFMSWVFGPGYRSEVTPAPGDKFWTAGLIGSRLVSFPDTNSAGFPASGLFKSLTGGDGVRIERKYGESYTAKLNCKFMFSSNELPDLSSERADMRRCILCTLGPIAQAPMAEYEDLLRLDAQTFITSCIVEYGRQVSEPGKQIPVDAVELEGWVDMLEEKYQVVADRRLTMGAGERCAAADMQRVLLEEFRDGRERKEFMKWLLRKHGVKRTVAKLRDRTSQKQYSGCSARSAPLSGVPRDEAF